MSQHVQYPAIPEEYAELWCQLYGFEFDKPGAIDTFEGKLKKQQRWSTRYSLRAIEEYWKYHFIRKVTGLEVAPPYVVDMVWHMHLQYTKSYWHKLCREILGEDVHHAPSDGTSVDRERCRNLYLQTLESYRRFFGEPPADIWPVPGQSRWTMLGYRLRDHMRWRWENLVRNVGGLWNHLGDTVGEALRHAPYPYH